MSFWNNYSKEGNYDPSQYPKKTIVLYFMLFFEAFFRIIFANFIFVLFSLPIVTIGASVSGLNTVMLKLTNDEHSFIFHDFFTAFKKNFLKSTGLYFIYLLFFAIAYFAVYYYFMELSNSLFMMLPLMLTGFITLTVALSLSYAFILITKTNFSIFKVIKLSFLCVFTNLWVNVAVILSILFVFIVTLELFPVGLLFPGIMGFSIISFTACFFAGKVLNKYTLI